MRTTGKVALLVLAALAVAFVAMIVYMVGRGFSAADQPTRVEAYFARRLRRLATPRSARAAKNPLPLTPEALAEGMAHFADHCAICHANDGSGVTEIGQGLYPKAPDMRLADTQDLGDGELYYIIRNGIRLTGMPAWGGSPKMDEDKDNWALVHFIRHLPKITPEEVEKMKAMNPKSPGELEESEEERRFLEGENPAQPEEKPPAKPRGHRH